VHQQGRQQPEPDACHRPTKNSKGSRQNAVVQLRVQRQQRASEKENEHQAKKKEDALEIALSSMSKDDNHPEQRQKRPCG